MPFVRFLVLVQLLIWPTTAGFAQSTDSLQKDLIDVLFRKRGSENVQAYRSQKKVHFSILPSAVSIPGGGRAVITAVNAAFYLGDPGVTNLSNVYLIPYTNLADRYGVFVRPNLWLARNTFNLIGDFRFAHFPQYSWGLGGNSPEWDRSLIDGDYIRFHQTILKRIHRNWYAGPGYALDHHYNIEESDFTGEGHLSHYGQGDYTSTTSSGLTASLVYDARQNAINPLGGAYLLVNWRWNDTRLGSTFTHNTLFIDGRKYFPLSPIRYNIIALRSYYWTVIDGELPYLDLPSTNWAPASGIASRGFQVGRYRSNAMWYAEAEHRYQLSANGMWGLVVFGNVSSASEFETHQFTYWHLGAGAGLRAKLNKFSDTNIAVDLAFSKNYWGVWLSIGEFF